MPYYCKDCSYRGRTSGQVGECPACGSFNLTNYRVPDREEDKPARWRLILMFSLWGYLAIYIVWKLSQ